MATSSDSVTLDRAYFETLLRKAQLHSSGVDHSTPVDPAMVMIPKVDYDGLLASSREYANLRRSLYRGGITDETLAILANDESTEANNQDSSTNLTRGAKFETVTLSTQAQIPMTPHGTDLSHRNGNDARHGKYTNHSRRHDGHPSDDFQQSILYGNSSPRKEGQGEGYFSNGNRYTTHEPGWQLLRNAKRTIQLTNLPESTTHADVTEAVRGGMLLDIFLRGQDRTASASASVSFLDENDASAYFRHAKRNDLYIRGKRVEISWAERHFTLPGHVANKIAMGATRNMVVRSTNTRHTEESIRADLEHIHNLVVINVKFTGQDAHISTNSVHNAMFARTCMMSRSKYKGSKIEWGVDECAAPIPTPRPRNAHKDNGPPKKGKAPINRFAVLSLHSAVDSPSDSPSDDENTTSDMPSVSLDCASGLNRVIV